MSLPEAEKPVTTHVRVIRMQKLDIVEYVDVELCRYPRDKADLTDETVAMNLVQAKEAAGEDLSWFNVSEKLSQYSHSDYSAELLPEPQTGDAEPQKL